MLGDQPWNKKQMGKNVMQANSMDIIINSFISCLADAGSEEGCVTAMFSLGRKRCQCIWMKYFVIGQHTCMKCFVTGQCTYMKCFVVGQCTYMECSVTGQSTCMKCSVTAQCTCMKCFVTGQRTCMKRF